ncbi:hypothetical protein [Pseudomonas sp. C9-3]|uniref:hypothetical protein n=1 Tax=Pseudomonas sp. C9-3 TaxID=3078264 RepID=UPI0028E48F75|nr:hypothetical protein [Pseudomonas sp. C9-3]
MFKPLRPWLPAQLLCSPLAAQAEGPSGDFWLIHQQGSLYKNEIFVIDGDPANIYDRKNGVRSLGVYQFYEEGAKPTFTAYDVEVDCAKNRVRLNGAQNYDKFYNDIRPKKVSKEWQKKPEAWIAQSRDFLCKPDAHVEQKMYPLGKMPMTQLVSAAPGLFQLQNREHAKNLILQMVDKGFEQMPVKNAPAKEGVQ